MINVPSEEEIKAGLSPPHIEKVASDTQSNNSITLLKKGEKVLGHSSAESLKTPMAQSQISTDPDKIPGFKRLPFPV